MALDIGTGDGRFVFRSALVEPETFFVGVDANAKPLQQISVKAERTLGRSRPANAIFARASAEDLPREFYGLADSISINFPWGSLLGAALRPDPSFLESLRKILKPGGELSLATAVDPGRDAAELKRLGLLPHFDNSLPARLQAAYRSAGFSSVELSEKELTTELPDTTWAKKLGRASARRHLTLYCRAP